MINVWLSMIIHQMKGDIFMATKFQDNRIPVVKRAENKIYRKMGSGKLMEILADGFPIKKVKFNFVSFDVSKPEGSRSLDTIAFWLDFEDALRLSNDILSGRYAKIFYEDIKKAEKDKKEGREHPQCTPFVKLGGTNAETLRQRNQERPDNKALSRVIKLTKGKLYLLTATTGPGRVGDKGQITPDGKPEKTIMIGLSDDELKEMALMIRMHLYAYTAATYLRAANSTEAFELAQLEGEHTEEAAEQAQLQKQAKELVDAGVISDLSAVNIDEEINEDALPF